MTIAAGSRLGPYGVLSPLGAGGMGEVWKAQDSRLDRTVAIKVLPEEFFEDADRLSRFEREAKALAALNHPGIAAVHSFEAVEGRHILVMELVEGEGLDARIARGAIPLDEALPIARQIAEALEAAHEKGIVHRDLKPANVMVSHDGRVKLLDFGLAKAFERPLDAAGRGLTAALQHPMEKSDVRQAPRHRRAVTIARDTRLAGDDGIAAQAEARNVRDESLLGEAYLAEGLREPSTSYSLRTANSPAASRASARSASIEEESVGTTA